MKFLDLKGLQDLWSKVLKTRTEVEASNENNALITIAATESAVTGSDGLGKKFTISLGGLENVASAAELEAGLEALYGGEIPASDAVTMSDLDDRIGDLESGSVVTVEKLQTPSSDAAATYVVKQNGQQVGVAIDIPKDFLVKSGSVRTIGASEATQDMPEGTKVLDFVVNTVEGDGQDTHILIPVTDLVDVYTGGNGIDVSNANVISGVVDQTSETFLTVGADGFKLTGVQAAINSAKSDVIGASTDTASADTINGAKAYADDAVADAAGDYATAAQGTTADSALQTISHGTDGSYVTTTIGKKANNDQTVGVAVTIQPITSASASAQGLAEASDVKDYIDNAVSTGTSNGAHKVASPTAGNLAGLDSNGDLTDSGYDPADFATAAQGALADTAIQSVTGETAVTNGNYVSVSVEAATDSTTKAVTLTSHANVTTHTVSDAVVSTADGLATAADVKSYVDGQKTAVDTAIADMDADLDASGTDAHSGTFVMSGITQVDGTITAIDSVEVEAAGAAAAAKTELLGDATTNGNTLGKLEDRLDAIEGSGSGSISDQINAKVATLDSDVNVAASASTGHVVSTSASNDGTTSAHVTAATVLTSLTITDGLFSAATSQTIEAISDSDLASILVAPSAQQNG